MEILVVRPDRMGDVVLSTPVFEVLKRHYPQARLTVMVREELVPLVRGSSYVDQVLIYDPNGKHKGFRGLIELYKTFKQGRFRVAVVLQSQSRIAFALFMARVRFRVGPLSKVHSFLFYNRGIRQRRSLVEMHESDYNLQLLRRLGIRVGTRTVPTRVPLSDESKRWAENWLKDRGRLTDKPLVAIHPGMGGSALNWPESHYKELILLLAQKSVQLLLTGGPTEGELLKRVAEEVNVDLMIYGGDQVLGVESLGALFSFCDVVVAPSTGPLHLAVAQGKKVVCFYPPIRVQSALRWGPYVADEQDASILVPEVYCGEDFECRGSLCNYFPCMKTLTVQQAYDCVQEQLASQLKNGD